MEENITKENKNLIQYDKLRDTFDANLPLNMVFINEKMYFNDLKETNDHKIFSCKLNNDFLELLKNTDGKKDSNTISLLLIIVKEVVGVRLKHFVLNSSKQKDIVDQVKNNIDCGKSLDHYLREAKESNQSSQKDYSNKNLYIMIDINYMPKIKEKCCGCFCCCCKGTTCDRYLHNMKLFFKVGSETNSQKDLEQVNDFLKMLLFILNQSVKQNQTSPNLSHLLITENTLTLPVNKKKFLFYINPIGGQGKAMKTWNSIKDIFINEQSFVDVEVFFTQYYRHAYQATLDIQDKNKYQGIICCSGDGIAHEVTNALMKKKTQKGFEDIDIPIGIIPSGTSNALAKVLTVEAGEEISSPKELAYMILRGDTRKIDLHKVEYLNTQETVYTFLTVTYAIIADIDLESEVYGIININI